MEVLRWVLCQIRLRHDFEDDLIWIDGFDDLQKKELTFMTIRKVTPIKSSPKFSSKNPPDPLWKRGICPILISNPNL